MYAIDVASESSDSLASSSEFASSSSAYSHRPASEIASLSVLSPPTSPTSSSFTSKIASSLRRTFKKRKSTHRLTVYGPELTTTSSISPTLPSFIVNVIGNPLTSLDLACKSASQLENLIASLSYESYPNVTSLEIRFPPLEEKDMQYTHLRLPRSGSDLPPITKVSLLGWNLDLVKWLTAHFRLTQFRLGGESPCDSASIQKLIDGNMETLTDLGLVLGSEDFFNLSCMYNLEHFEVRVLHPDSFGAQDTIRTVSKVLRLNTLKSVRIILNEAEDNRVPLEVLEEHSGPDTSGWTDQSLRTLLFDFDDNYLVAKDGIDTLLNAYDARVVSTINKRNVSL
ncbi:hypothetical protein BDZ89DRAFT_727338 [Hymenopellis radicata]|nr:hypothetical protein BDZ89DRAFT_727338 [Hymenopellis radicata]